MFDKYCRITIKIEIDEQILAPRSTRYSRRVLPCPKAKSCKFMCYFVREKTHFILC